MLSEDEGKDEGKDGEQRVTIKRWIFKQWVPDPKKPEDLPDKNGKAPDG